MPSARLDVGRVFAQDFKVLGVIAEGGMGVVYEVEQLSTRKRRALKVVQPRLLSDAKARERFVREATVGASIDSEHVVEVLGAGIEPDGTVPWLVMELLIGADLGAVVGHRGPLAFPQTVEVLRQMCHGLAAAHRGGVVHRDLKPANVFIARSRRAGEPFTVKILDFGLAKVVENVRSGATETETVGSPMWMAPEQLDARRPSPRTDVWALGLIAFWTLTGHHYWQTPNKGLAGVQALFVEQLFKPLDPATVRAASLGVADRLPAGFDEWFAGCVQREESERFADASEAFAAWGVRVGSPPDDEVAAACQNLLPDDLPAPSTSAGPVRQLTPTESQPAPSGGVTGYEPTLEPGSAAPLRPQAPAPTRRGWLAAVAGMTVASAAAAGTWWYWRHNLATDDEGPPEPGADEAEASAAEPASDPAAELPPTPTPRKRRTETPSDSGAAAEAGDDAAAASEAALARRTALETLVVPLRHQPAHEAHDVDTLGWSEHGDRLVLSMRYLEPDRAQRLRLLALVDTLTGVAVESYRLDPGEAPELGRGRLAKLAKEAQPLSAWRERKAQLGLVLPHPSPTPVRVDPAIAWRVEWEADAAPQSTTLDLTRGERGLRFSWRGFDGPMPSRQTKGPVIRVTLVHGEERWPLLETAVPYTVGDLAAHQAAAAPTTGPAVSGRIDMQWSPDGERVLLLLEAGFGAPGAGDDETARRHAQYWLRSCGPRIRIVEAGAGQRAARRAALTLADEGYPVAEVALREPPVASSKVLHRRGHEGGASLARRIGELLSLSEGSKASRASRATITVVLGQDYAD